MKAFISQPMRGKTNEEIKEERQAVIERLEQMGYEVIDSIFDYDDKNPIYYLGKSIEAMSDADLVVFMKGFNETRGCQVEYCTAMAYEKEIFILN